jgi:hypothetical protein
MCMSIQNRDRPVKTVHPFRNIPDLKYIKPMETYQNDSYENAKNTQNSNSSVKQICHLNCHMKLCTLQ